MNPLDELLEQTKARIDSGGKVISAEFVVNMILEYKRQTSKKALKRLYKL